MVSLPLNRHYWSFTSNVELIRLEWELVVRFNGEEFTIPFDSSTRTKTLRSTEQLISELLRRCRKQIESELTNPNSPGSPSLEPYTGPEFIPNPDDVPRETKSGKIKGRPVR